MLKNIFVRFSGLKRAKFITPTEIQRESIGLALKGCDILGAAKTGSGKTLAFIVPVQQTLTLIYTMRFVNSMNDSYNMYSNNCIDFKKN